MRGRMWYVYRGHHYFVVEKLLAGDGFGEAVLFNVDLRDSTLVSSHNSSEEAHDEAWKLNNVMGVIES